MPLQTIKQSDSAYYGNIRPSQQCVTNPISSGRELHLCVRSKCLLPSSLDTDGHSSQVSTAGLIFNILAVRKRAVIRRITVAGRVASHRSRSSTGLEVMATSPAALPGLGRAVVRGRRQGRRGWAGVTAPVRDPLLDPGHKWEVPKCWWKGKIPAILTVAAAELSFLPREIMIRWQQLVA